MTERIDSMTVFFDNQTEQEIKMYVENVFLKLYPKETASVKWNRREIHISLETDQYCWAQKDKEEPYLRHVVLRTDYEFPKVSNGQIFLILYSRDEEWRIQNQLKYGWVEIAESMIMKHSVKYSMKEYPSKKHPQSASLPH